MPILAQYVPEMTHPDPANLPDLGRSGDGSPEGIKTGSPGDTYWDATNDTLYVKDTGVGTNTGWVAQ